ncbi:MAG TPA: MarR family transcriptional regulator [Candidatus Dormibacteraeota bacterium]|nr:MarR family transcriptional regulator [Candidatus Dormibacteraeota bacterium]
MSPADRPLVEAVLAELRALAAEIDRLDRLAADRYGLNRTDLHSLEIVGSSGGLTPTDLAQALGFTTGGVTTVIDRLERAGYARRRPDPGDRRRVVVEPTELTAERDAEVFGQLILSTQQIAATYTDAELAVIRDFLERNRMAMAAHGDALQSHDSVEPDSSER